MHIANTAAASPPLIHSSLCLLSQGSGAAAGGSVGFTDTLPADVTAVVVGGQNYYVSKGVYYQECFMGSDVNYCVVPAPQ